ncbi:FG-GAP repeat protein [Streptomyces massasporeus]|uniref:FG-GAP repeat protein n=1 Tax=Streptomyces massasporeus TaxID=67324 RepID=UPI00368743B6
MAVADLNRDGPADIVAGSPGEDAGTANAGQVTVVPGGRTGALGGGAHAFTQDTAGIPGAGETEDEFDTTGAAGDIDEGSRPKLFISAVTEDSSTGAVRVLPGGAGGPTARGSRMITASSAGLRQRESSQFGGTAPLG